jgi:hypothetical protein
MNERVQRRDRLIEQAVVDGRILGERRDHYRNAWDRDPFGTEQLLASLSPGLTPDVRAALFGQQDPNPELALAQTLFPELRQPRPLGHGGTPAPLAAATPAPAQTPHRRPVALPEGAELSPPAAEPSLTPEEVAAWSRALFPETVARKDAEAGLVSYADD